eukprot:197749-Rhodomonas_salina.1
MRAQAVSGQEGVLKGKTRGERGGELPVLATARHWPRSPLWQTCRRPIMIISAPSHLAPPTSRNKKQDNAFL